MPFSCRRCPVTNGFTRIFLELWTPRIPSSTPAYDILNWLNCRGVGLQSVASLVWRISRKICSPQICSSSLGNRSCLNGTEISTYHMPGPTDDRQVQTPSQFALIVRPSSYDCESRRAQPGLVWKLYAFSRS